MSTAGPGGTAVPPGPLSAPRLLAVAAAVAAAGCAAVHGVLVLTGPRTPTGARTAVVVAACLLCAAHLARRGGGRAWALHVLGTTTMLLLHGTGSPAHHHLVPPAGVPGWAGPLAGQLALLALLLAAVRAAGWLLAARSDRLAAAGPQSSGAACTDDSARRVPQA